MRQIRIAALASTALIAGLAQSASGADMQVPYRQPAPPPGPVFTWTGLYFGGHGGCAHDRKNYGHLAPSAAMILALHSLSILPTVAAATGACRSATIIRWRVGCGASKLMRLGARSSRGPICSKLNRPTLILSLNSTRS